jgi:hypothetical protein
MVPLLNPSLEVLLNVSRAGEAGPLKSEAIVRSACVRLV